MATKTGAIEKGIGGIGQGEEPGKGKMNVIGQPC